MGAVYADGTERVGHPRGSLRKLLRHACHRDAFLRRLAKRGGIYDDTDPRNQHPNQLHQYLMLYHPFDSADLANTRKGSRMWAASGVESMNGYLRFLVATSHLKNAPGSAGCRLPTDSTLRPSNKERTLSRTIGSLNQWRTAMSSSACTTTAASSAASPVATTAPAAPSSSANRLFFLISKTQGQLQAISTRRIGPVLEP